MAEKTKTELQEELDKAMEDLAVANEKAAAAEQACIEKDSEIVTLQAELETAKSQTGELTEQRVMSVIGGKPLNARKGPGAESNVITKLAAGADVRLDGDIEDGWQPIVIPAWCMAEYLA